MMKRRDFLKIAGSSLLISGCKPISESREYSARLYSGYRDGDPYVSKNAGLSIGGTAGRREIKLKNEIHSTVHSKKFDLKVFIPKLETTAYAQFGDGVLQPFESLQGHYFYGHAVIDEKRGLMYSTHAVQTADRSEKSRLDKPGFVYIHSLPDLKLVGSFSSYGFDPHEAIIHNDQLVVCNGGRDSSIAFIDLNTRKLTKDYKIGLPWLALRHIEPVDDDNYVIATLSTSELRPSSLYSLNRQTGLKRHPCPSAIDNRFVLFQMLSVKYHGGFVYGTIPATAQLVVYDFNKGFVGALNVPSPCNLAYSKHLGGMIVGCAQTGEPARVVNVERGQLVVAKIPWAQEVTGAHSLLLET